MIEALLVGIAVGIVLGALGAGGGILAVPILVYILHQEPHVAAASSLVIVGVTALTSLPHHARKKNVQWRQGLLFGALSVVGAFAGSRLSVLVPPQVLMTLFAGLLAAVSVAMLVRGLRARAAEKSPDAAPAPEGNRPIRWGWVAVTATLTGFLTGFFGVGGGFIVVPMLVFALGLGIRAASGTSLVVMIVVASASLLSRIGTPVTIDWPLTLMFTLGSALGGMAGGPLSSRAKPSTLTLIFAALLAVVSVYTAVETLIL